MGSVDRQRQLRFSAIVIRSERRARLLNTLLFKMTPRGVSKGLATFCSGGMGIAMYVESL
ncbi:hypothetical protein NKH13_30140 [Mesorhizobium sp. M1348]